MSNKLRIDSPLRMHEGRLVLAFSGWMDGGDVSTGTVQRLVDQIGAEPTAEIDSEGFYIFSFPGDTEVTALFRPRIKIVDGVVEKFEATRNRFFTRQDKNLALFLGKEPHLNWREFADSIFEFVDEMGVTSIYFVGSFAGSVPHTREPRMHVSVSDPSLKTDLLRYGLRPTNYEGPGSFMTYLTTQATERAVKMANIAAEIPAYLQGTNPSSIEAVTRRLAAILRLEVDLSPLRTTSNDWEGRISEAIRDEEGMIEQIRRLEAEYDDDLIDAASGDGVPDLEGF